MSDGTTLAATVHDVTPATLVRLRKRVGYVTRRYPRTSANLRDDALAFALLKAVEKDPQVPHFEHWIVCAARNWLHKQVFQKGGSASRRHYPAEMFAESIPHVVPSALESITNAEREAALHRAMAQLSTTRREVLQAYYFDNVPLQTIAAQKGVARGGINMCALRARQQLRKALLEFAA